MAAVKRSSLLTITLTSLVHCDRKARNFCISFYGSLSLIALAASVTSDCYLVVIRFAFPSVLSSPAYPPPPQSMARIKQARPVERQASSEYISHQSATLSSKRQHDVAHQSNGAVHKPAHPPISSKPDAGATQLVIAVSGIYGSLYVLSIYPSSSACVVYETRRGEARQQTADR